MQLFCVLFLYLLVIIFAYDAFKDIRNPRQEPQTPEPPQVIYIKEPQPAPVQVQEVKPAPVAPIPEPQKEEPKTDTEPPKMDRRQLEQTARNCLTAAGCKFDTWSYCRYKSDIELMDIIKDHNLNK